MHRSLPPVYYLLSIVLVVLAASIFTIIQTPVQAANTEPPLPPASSSPGIIASNYCISCHLADDPRLETVTTWQGSVQQEVDSPCPAAKRIHEELYYTERQMLMIDRARQQPGGEDTKLAARVDASAQAYSRLLDEPVTSLNAFISKAQMVRYRLGKLYYSQNQLIETRKMQMVFLFAILISLVVLGSLFWGLRNTQSAQGSLLPAGNKRRNFLILTAIFLLLVLVFFALPIFTVPAAEVAAATEEALARQATLDTAQRSATAADRAQARAWMLAYIGSRWREANPQAGQGALEEALAALEVAQNENGALWGTAQSAQEATVGDFTILQKAGLIANQLEAARARQWAAPLIGHEWQSSNPEQNETILETIEGAADRDSGVYRDLQLRSVALGWMTSQPGRANAVAARISEPALRSWTQREIATLTGDERSYELAAQAASQVQDAVQRARLLREIGTASGDPAYFEQAAASLQNVTGAAQAYVLSKLAIASNNATLLERIDPGYPDARATALLHFGLLEEAWQAAGQISDPYEQGRAQAAIAAASGDAGLAEQIAIPLYRDLALRDITRKTGEASLAPKIQSPYYRVQAFSSLKQFADAWEAAADLSETYPLVEFVTAWAQSDPQAALQVVDKINLEVDKAAALRAIAVSQATATGSKDTALFERALGMALASRVRNDSLSPAQASLDLAMDFLTLDPGLAEKAFAQAHEAAQRIAIK